MSIFFMDRWRITGCIVLTLAVAVMGLWFRSFVISDQIVSDFSNCKIATKHGSLYWLREEIEYTDTIWFKCGGPGGTGWRWETRATEGSNLQPSEDCQFSMRHRLLGAEFSTARLNRQISDLKFVQRFWCWSVSLLWMVFPLTVLAAYLIIAKPRRTPTRKLRTEVDFEPFSR